MPFGENPELPFMHGCKRCGADFDIYLPAGNWEIHIKHESNVRHRIKIASGATPKEQTTYLKTGHVPESVEGDF